MVIVLNSVGKNFHTIAELQCGCDADVFHSLRCKVSGGNFSDIFMFLSYFRIFLKSLFNPFCLFSILALFLELLIQKPCLYW